MLFDWFGTKAPIRRIVVDQDVRWKITLFGSNNLYPQEMHQIMLRSPLVKASVGTLADFINGEGFQKNDEEPINDRGENINDVLAAASHDFAEYDGFALLLDIDGTGTVFSVSHLPFEFVRFGLPD